MRYQLIDVLLIIFIVATLSCNPNDYNNIMDQPEIVESTYYKIDTVEFATPRSVHELPFRIFSLPSKKHNSLLYVGYDRRTHNIDWFNNNKKKFRFATQLDQSGPNGITEIASIYYHSSDSLFILELNPNRLWLMDQNGQMSMLVDIKEQSKNDISMDGLFAVNYNNASPIYLADDKIYFALRSYNNKYDFTIPVIGYYNLIEKRLMTLDIHYPQAYRDEAYGFYDFANVVFTDSRIIVNFPISTAIYIYDLQGNLLKKVSAIENFSYPEPLQTQEKSANAFLEHLNSNPFLYPLQTFKNGDYYLQFRRDAVPEDAQNTIFGYNLIYDKNFETVRILKMNKILFSMGDDFLYHQIPLERTDTQYIERYELSIE